MARSFRAASDFVLSAARGRASRCPIPYALPLQVVAMLHPMRRAPGWLLGLALATFSAGCESEKQPEGKVFGKVTFRGQPVTEGTISFHNEAAGFGAEALLEADGSYRLPTGLAVGEYKVSVFPPLVINSSDPRTPPVTEYKKVNNIPGKYHIPATSPLTATIQEGDNPREFDLQ
jgi:hypothetical protein